MRFHKFVLFQRKYLRIFEVCCFSHAPYIPSLGHIHQCKISTRTHVNCCRRMAHAILSSPSHIVKSQLVLVVPSHILSFLLQHSTMSSNVNLKVQKNPLKNETKTQMKVSKTCEFYVPEKLNETNLSFNRICSSL